MSKQITTRRSVLTSAAAIAAPGGAALAASASDAAANASPVPTKLDPIFGAIEETRAAYATARAVNEQTWGLKPSDPQAIELAPAQDEAEQKFDMALAVLFTTAPTTPEGAAALLRYIDDEGGPGRGEFFNRTDEEVREASQDFHGRLAGAIEFMAGLNVGRAAITNQDGDHRYTAGGSPDPVLVLLERYHAAGARRDAVSKQYGHLSLAEQKAVGAEEQYAAFDGPVGEIEREMVRTVPTTFAGIRAVLVLAAEREDIWCPLPKDEDEQVIFYNSLIKAIDRLGAHLLA